MGPTGAAGFFEAGEQTARLCSFCLPSAHILLSMRVLGCLSHRAAPVLGFIAAVSLLAASGCSGGPDMIGSGPQYPPVKQTRVVDVQVLRDETEVTLTNTTAADLPAGLLWINAWFSAPFEGLRIGQTVTLQLVRFTDRYGRSFRAGGFFATELPDRLVLAQLQPASADGAAADAPGPLAALTPGFRPELIGFIVIRPVE